MGSGAAGLRAEVGLPAGALWVVPRGATGRGHEAAGAAHLAVLDADDAVGHVGQLLEGLLAQVLGEARTGDGVRHAGQLQVGRCR